MMKLNLSGIDCAADDGDCLVYCGVNGQMRCVSVPLDICHAFRYVAYHHGVCYATRVVRSGELDLRYEIRNGNAVIITFVLEVGKDFHVLHGEFEDYDVTIEYDNGIMPQNEPEIVLWSKGVFDKAWVSLIGLKQKF